MINRSSGIPRCYYARRVLIDSGINAIFEGMKLKEYPKRYLENYHIYARRVARKIRRKNPNCEIWVVIPDYPADLPDNILENNVERTIENWLKFKDKGDKSFVWMPSIQAKRMDFESFVYSIEKFKEIFGENYPIAGIGTDVWKDYLAKLEKMLEKAIGD